MGDAVIGGTINQDGRLTVRTTAVGSATALSQIVQLVEKAQDSRPPVQKLADQIAAVFVPTVLGIALLTGIGWYAWGVGASLVDGGRLGTDRQDNLQRAVDRLPVCAGVGCSRCHHGGHRLGARRGHF